MSNSQEIPAWKRNILPVILILIGIGAMWLGINEVLNARASLNWPAVIGTVTRTAVDTDTGSTSGTSGTTSSKSTTYRAVVEYNYVVGDKTYEGSRIKFGHGDTEDPEDAQRVIEPYAEGQRVDIYYNPEKPHLAVLQPGSHGFPWFYILFGGAFALVGWGLYRFFKAVYGPGSSG